MSVSDPLIKEFKGHTARLMETAREQGAVTDACPSLQPFCQTLEQILLKGLNDTFVLGAWKNDCWYWLEHIACSRFSPPFAYASGVRSVRKNCKVSTPRGRFRLLVRMCLVQCCMHAPIEKLVRMRPSPRTYTPGNSIMGDEILGEIFLSVLLQCSKLRFNLQLKNACFLDETWQLGEYVIHEFVPCQSLGMCVGFVLNKGVVVRVEPCSVAEEDDKVMIGDLIDEINSTPVNANIRGKLSSLMRQAAGKPVTVNLIKANCKDGNLYPPMKALHVRLNIEAASTGVKSADSDDGPVEETHTPHRAGFPVAYAGQVSTGDKGDISQIADAITKVVAMKLAKKPAQIEILEMGVRVSDRSSGEVTSKHSYMEISSCGQQDRLPNYFAYIAGDKSCNSASEFTCYVFHSSNQDQITNILHSIVWGKGSVPNVRPNILLLVADDMGWGDLGANQPDQTSDTPQLDKLARQGIRLTDFHAAASVCSPSRAALLTGRLGMRTGVITNFVPESVGGLPLNETTLAEMLKSSGYRTAMLGKWHLGTQQGFHPMDRGFQHYLGVPYSVDMGCSSPPGLDFPPRYSCSAARGNKTRSSLALPLYQNRKIKHQPVKLKSLAKMYADFGIKFIKSSRDDAPFFLYAAFSHVHVPLAHSRRFNVTGRGIFANSVAEMDWLVAQLVSAATNRRSEAGTLTWFLSDNGAWEAKCALAGSGGKFTGSWQRNLQQGGGGSASKQTVWEAGHRVPSIIHWPNHIKAGVVLNDILSALDVFPTIATITGSTLPPYRKYDGLDVTSLLFNTSSSYRLKRDILYHPNSGAAGPEGEIGAVRLGRYKVVMYSGGSSACGEMAAPKRKLQPPLVFNLQNDPAESSPITNKHQSIEILERATTVLEKLKESIRADNTSLVDYSKSKSARPCCHIVSLICACPWD